MQYRRVRPTPQGVSSKKTKTGCLIEPVRSPPPDRIRRPALTVLGASSTARETATASAGRARLHCVRRSGGLGCACSTLRQKALRTGQRGFKKLEVGYQLEKKTSSPLRAPPALPKSKLAHSAQGAAPLSSLVPWPAGNVPAPRARNPRSPSPSPSPICRGSGMDPRSPARRGSGVHSHPHPRFAGDRGSTPIPIPVGFARIGDPAEYH